MRELLVILHREFFERIRARSFILSTLLIPLLVMAFGLGSLLLGRNSSAPDFHVVVVDETPTELGEQIQLALQSEGTFTVDLLRVPLPDVHDSLTALVRADRIDGYLHLPASLTEGGAAQIWTDRALSNANRMRVRTAVTSPVQRERLAHRGLTSGDVLELLRPVQINDARITESEEQEQTGGQAQMGFVAAFVLFNLIMLYGTQVMRSAQEEKASRISEILVSSVSAPNLMLGKVLGVGFAAFLQIAIWIVLFSTPILFRNRLESIGVPVEEIAAALSAVDPGAVAVGLTFAILGFFLYSTLFAAVGAAAETIEDAQRFTIPLIMPLMVPIFLTGPIRDAPSGTLAVVTSWIPFMTPAVMPMRLFSGGAGMTEALASLGWLVLSVIAAGWLAGRIYRAAILNTGRRTGWPDLLSWMKAG